MCTNTPQPQPISPDPVLAEIHAVAREARRIAEHGATDDQRAVFNARRRAVVAAINDPDGPDVTADDVARDLHDLDPTERRAVAEVMEDLRSIRD